MKIAAIIMLIMAMQAITGCAGMGGIELDHRIGIRGVSSRSEMVKTETKAEPWACWFSSKYCNGGSEANGS